MTGYFSIPVSFCLFSFVSNTNFTEKTVCFSRIRTRWRQLRWPIDHHTAHDWITWVLRCRNQPLFQLYHNNYPNISHSYLYGTLKLCCWYGLTYIATLSKWLKTDHAYVHIVLHAIHLTRITMVTFSDLLLPVTWMIRNEIIIIPIVWPDRAIFKNSLCQIFS